jgi:hypothetical protein
MYVRLFDISNDESQEEAKVRVNQNDRWAECGKRLNIQAFIPSNICCSAKAGELLIQTVAHELHGRPLLD